MLIFQAELLTGQIPARDCTLWPSWVIPGSPFIVYSQNLKREVAKVPQSKLISSSGVFLDICNSSRLL